MKSLSNTYFPLSKSVGYLEEIKGLSSPKFHIVVTSLGFAADTGEEKTVAGCRNFFPEFETFVQIQEGGYQAQSHNH